MLVECLKENIPIIVSPYQLGFVSGQSIHENIIVGQEIMLSMSKIKGKKGLFTIKLDLSKAYDKLSWEFIQRIFEEIELPLKMTNIIMHGVTSVETNIKQNGTSFEFFRPSRGIRQGDLVCPYIFVLCTDKLLHLIMQAVDKGDWRTIKAGKYGSVVSHLMFADDLLLFGEATTRQMQSVKSILNKFCNMSGEQVRHKKTIIFLSKNANRRTMEQLVHMSGFKETTFFGKYIGVLLTGKALKRGYCEYMIDQVSTKLTM